MEFREKVNVLLEFPNPAEQVETAFSVEYENLLNHILAVRVEMKDLHDRDKLLRHAAEKMEEIIEVWDDLEQKDSAIFRKVQSVVLQCDHDIAVILDKL